MRKFKYLVCVFGTLFLLVSCAETAFAGGLSITLENDVLFDRDRDYSNGIQIEWVPGVAPGRVPGQYRRAYGINQRMYTPKNLDIGAPFPDDRPWAGTLEGYVEFAALGSSLLSEGFQETSVTRVSIGVLGPSAGTAEVQRWMHKLLDCTYPEGWEYQLKDELMVNIDHTRFLHLYRTPSWYDCSASFDFIYGGIAGTTYIIGRTGAEIKAGYNVPSMTRLPGIREADKFGYAYFFAAGTGNLQLHNATLGSSVFRNHRDARELEPVFAECALGMATGWRRFEASVSVNARTSEFRSNSEDGSAWGVFRLGYGMTL